MNSVGPVPEASNSMASRITGSSITTKKTTTAIVYRPEDHSMVNHICVSTSLGFISPYGHYILFRQAPSRAIGRTFNPNILRNSSIEEFPLQYGIHLQHIVSASDALRPSQAQSHRRCIHFMRDLRVQNYRHGCTHSINPRRPRCQVYARPLCAADYTRTRLGSGAITIMLPDNESI